MSADAASLPCPICLHTGAFNSVQSLRDRLINVSTNNILCPVCQEEVSGLDKLTIHLFSHVKLLTAKRCSGKDQNRNIKIKPETENQTRGMAQQKKSRSSAAKNKTLSSTANMPVKFVKIYPKLPVLSLNTVPIIDIYQKPIEENTQACNSVDISVAKTEPSINQTTFQNTTCNICGLQFVDVNILKMHKCLIHNIEEDSSQNFTRYHCHLCPKNFKMRGSLMVHLRVAHYGFLSGGCKLPSNSDKELKEKSPDQISDDKLSKFERNDNKQWQCDVCRKCFTTKYFLKKHKRLHTGETPYACTQCNKTFTFQQSYHKHLLYHNDEKPHTCNYCGRAFKELSTLHNHQRIHTGEKPFSCETCGKCFRQRVSYLVHRRIHTGVMPYKCTACDKSFRYKVSQRTHKCLAQPPGTVVRQTGDLVEKLKKKYVDSDVTTEPQGDVQYLEVSEVNAELVRTSAKLSLQDTETENFTLIDEAFTKNNIDQMANSSCISKINKSIRNEEGNVKNDEMFDSNIEELIDSIPIIEKNIPSPSEILKNLCLSKEEDYIGISEDLANVNDFNTYKEYNVLL